MRLCTEPKLSVVMQSYIIVFFTLLFSSHSFAENHVGGNEDVDGKPSSQISNEDTTLDIVRSEVAQRSYDQIEEVLAREEFGRTEYVKAWRLVDSEDEEARKEKFPEWLIKIFEWLEKREKPEAKEVGSSLLDFALILEVLLWGLAIGLVLFVLIKYHKQITGLTSLLGRSKNTSPLPTTMFGLDIKKESLPDDIIANARQHWQKNEVRLAIAMLLRASLINLLNDHDCRFYDSDTEAECCLRIDKQVTKPLSQFMRSLVAVWQQVAYAHRTPSEVEFDSLCEKWTEVFL